MNTNRIISQNPVCFQTHRNDRNNPFHYACREWMINHYFEKKNVFENCTIDEHFSRPFQRYI